VAVGYCGAKLLKAIGADDLIQLCLDIQEMVLVEISDQYVGHED
jgi:hypothetical protein